MAAKKAKVDVVKVSHTGLIVEVTAKSGQYISFRVEDVDDSGTDMDSQVQDVNGNCLGFGVRDIPAAIKGLQTLYDIVAEGE